MNVTYSQQFIEAVKGEYPDWQELHAKLDQGSQMVGRYLEDSAGWGFSAEKVLDALDSGTVESLRLKAEEIIRRRALLAQWWVEIESTGK